MTTVEKARKKRSPAYPAHSLEQAIEKARILNDTQHEHFAPLESVAEHWDSKLTSSAFMQYLSSLKQFGLLEEDGSGEGRRFRITELARDILDRPEGLERSKALQVAALMPKVHKELWEKYAGNLPSDVTIRTYLIRERQEGTFNKSHVDSFIEQFHSTIEFAKLCADDKIEHEEEESEKADLNRGFPDFSSFFGDFYKTSQAGKLNPKQPQAQTMRDLPITLPSLQVAILRVPYPMSKLDFSTLTSSLAAFEGALVQQPAGGSEPKPTTLAGGNAQITVLGKDNEKK